MSLRHRLHPSALACVLITLVAAGCAMPPAHLDFAAPPGSTDATPAVAKADAPRVYLAPLEDLRLDQENIGQVGGRPYRAASIMPWLEQELREQVAAHVQLVSVDSKPALIVHPRLHKLYVDGLSVTKAAIVVLELSFTTPEGENSRRVYRGQFAGMNWWNSEAEMKTALRLALKNCLERCGPDMNARTLLASQPKPH